MAAIAVMRICMVAIIHGIVLLSATIFASPDVVFPPILEPVGVMRGHMKPLGYQNEAEGPVKEYDHFLSASDFWEKHGKDRIPLVYRGTVKKSFAVGHWTDDYLMKTYGDLDVLVEHKRENRSSSSGRMRLSDFLTRYRKEDMYIVSMLPEEMMHDIQAVNTVLCGTWKNFTHESNLWMSNGGTRSVVHYDADHNFHCVLEGRKDFIMMKNNKEHRKILGIHRYNPDAGSGFSLLDPDAINVTKTPDIYKLNWEYATLYPGDCIYIPRAHLHQVRSYIRTIAATTLFTEDTKMDFTGRDCQLTLINEFHSMSEIHFHWTYKKGDQMIDMGFQNLELFRIDFAKSVKKVGKMTLKKFKAYVRSQEYGEENYDENTATKCFKALVAAVGKGYVEIDDVKQLSLSMLKKIVRLVEAPHGVVTDGKEKVLVRPGDEARKENNKVMSESENDFVRYIRKLFNAGLKNNHNKIAYNIFKRLMLQQGSERSDRLEEDLKKLFYETLGGKSKGFLDRGDVKSFTPEQFDAILDLSEDIRGFQGQGGDDSQGLESAYGDKNLMPENEDEEDDNDEEGENEDDEEKEGGMEDEDDKDDENDNNRDEDAEEVMGDAGRRKEESEDENRSFNDNLNINSGSEKAPKTSDSVHEEL